MTSELLYVLDDVLEMKYGYGRDERKEILEFLLREKGKIRVKEISYLECFLLDSILVCASRQKEISVKKFIFCNGKKQKQFSVDLSKARKKH